MIRYQSENICQIERERSPNTQSHLPGSYLTTMVVGWFVFTLILAIFVGRSPIRYVAYMTPIFMLLLSLLRMDLVLKNNFRIIVSCVSYLVLVFVSVANGAKVDDLFIRDVLIVFGGFVTFLWPYRITLFHVKFVTIGFLILTIALYFLKVRHGGVLSFDLLTSKGGIESQVAFPAGIISIFFLINKKYSWFLMSLILCLLGFKRIVIGAFFISVVVYISLSYFSYSKRMLLLKLVTISIFLSMTVIGLFFPYIVTYVFDKIGISGMENMLTLGRFNILIDILNDLGNADMQYILFGHGLGSSQFGGNTLPHDDFVKILVEYGLVGGTAVLILIWTIFRGREIGFYILIYQSVLYVTDNTFIYYFQWFTIAVLLLCEISSKYDNKKITYY